MNDETGASPTDVCDAAGLYEVEAIKKSKAHYCRHEPGVLRFGLVVRSSAMQQGVDHECGQGVRVLCG